VWIKELGRNKKSFGGHGVKMGCIDRIFHPNVNFESSLTNSCEES